MPQEMPGSPPYIHTYLHSGPEVLLFTLIHGAGPGAYLALPGTTSRRRLKQHTSWLVFIYSRGRSPSFFLFLCLMYDASLEGFFLYPGYLFSDTRRRIVSSPRSQNERARERQTPASSSPFDTPPPLSQQHRKDKKREKSSKGRERGGQNVAGHGKHQ
jgi:hypothetical protein